MAVFQTGFKASLTKPNWMDKKMKRDEKAFWWPHRMSSQCSMDAESELVGFGPMTKERYHS
jgi:hypothetical protein